MWCSPLPPVLRLLAPVFAARFATVLAAVAALVARRFVQMPALAPHTRMLWGWLQRRIVRCARLADRIAAGLVPMPRPRGGARPAGSQVRIVLPRGHGWLVQALGSDAAGYGCQIQALLDDPDMARLLVAAPGLARLMAPIRQMLGAGTAVARPRPVRTRPVRPRPVRMLSRAAMVAMGATLMLPIPHQFAWPRGPDRAG